MKCKICDEVLTDEEATYMHPVTLEYVDECLDCHEEVLNDIYTMDKENGK